MGVAKTRGCLPQEQTLHCRSMTTTHHTLHYRLSGQTQAQDRGARAVLSGRSRGFTLHLTECSSTLAASCLGVLLPYWVLLTLDLRCWSCTVHTDVPLLYWRWGKGVLFPYWYWICVVGHVLYTHMYHCYIGDEKRVFYYPFHTGVGLICFMWLRFVSVLIWHLVFNNVTFYLQFARFFNAFV